MATLAPLLPCSDVVAVSINLKYIETISSTADPHPFSRSVFLSDKTATNRERDLIKSLKDQDVGRNFPGRVKLAIPQSLKPKK